jgi:hypothetical protein
MNSAKQPRFYFYVVGLIMMAFAFYGHLSSLDCSSQAAWPSYLYMTGAVVFGAALFQQFYRNNKSYPKSGILSLLLVILILFAGVFLAVVFQPDGIWHCYQF